MAIVHLGGSDQQVTDHLPSVCVCCGKRATGHKEKTFAWFPRWTYLLLIVGALPYVILAMALQKRMRVRLPVCERHQGPPVGLILFRIFAVFYLLGLPWIVIAVSASTERTLGRGNPLAVTLLVGWLVGIFVLLGLLVAVNRRQVRPIRITNDTLTLTGVSEQFADRLGGRGALGQGFAYRAAAAEWTSYAR
jgi:hypothetical protein